MDIYISHKLCVAVGKAFVKQITKELDEHKDSSDIKSVTNNIRKKMKK
jgi:hypothetical protein